MQASDVFRAKAAAISIAAAVDLPVDDAIVVRNSNKLALRLTPCDVFARVAHVGKEVAQLEVELAQRLAETESPVACLEPRVEPRVYERDGFAITLWTFYESVTPVEPGAGFAPITSSWMPSQFRVPVPSTTAWSRSWLRSTAGTTGDVRILLIRFTNRGPGAPASTR